MNKIEHETLQSADERKKSHLNLASDSQSNVVDSRFNYEPMLSGHPKADDDLSLQFGNKKLKYPLWISSMTGGTSEAGPINRTLAKVAREFGIGLGLGSCRIILEDDTYFEDFNLRSSIGDEAPFYANLGIAQIEKIVNSGQFSKIVELTDKLSADGLIIHVNPLQEWLQPEGDLIEFSPLETIDKILNEVDVPIIVKEVGQGFGPESILELLKRPFVALEFGANGGTNFSKLELLRNEDLKEQYKSVANLGHGANEMTDFLNLSLDKLGDKVKCENVIISGGVKDFLDGYYYVSKANMPAAYGQAYQYLKHANKGEEALREFVKNQIEGYKMASKYLSLK